MKIPSLIVLLSSTLAAQDAPVASGPKPGTKLTKVAVYAAVGDRKGQEFDAAEALAQGPAALLFVHEITRETAPVIRNVDAFAARYGLLGFRAETVVLAADRTEAEKRIATVSNAIQMRNPMLLSLDGAEGPGNYALNRDCTLTLVLSKDGVVHKSMAFTDTGAKDVPAVRAAIEEITGALPKDAAELAARLPDDPAKLKAMVGALWQEVERLQKQLEQQRGRGMRGRPMDRQRPQRPGRPEPSERPERPREGKAPEDAKLQSLLRSLIQKDNTAEDVDAALGKIDAHVGESEALRKQVLDGFQLMLSLDYGNEIAQKRMREYRSKHAGQKGEVVR